VSLPLNYIGEARLRVPIALATVAINVLLDVILIPKIGVIAGAVSSDVAYILYVSAHFVICARKFQLKLGRLAMTFVRGMLAAAAASGALAAFGTAAHLSPLSWIGGALAAGAAFAAVLVATREVSVGDLASVRRLARR
jgi:O-antigen/teichoic acid export membrane protein